MKRNESFNSAAKLYYEVRPSYPKQAIDWIINQTNISLDNDLLELAPVTGQATIRFAEKGYKIHAVELGDNLAELLKKNCKDYNVTVDVSSFEDWQSNNKYNMIYCATAFHWLDKDIRYHKCHDLLKEDGYLVLLWNNAAVGVSNEIINEAFKLLFEYYPERTYSTDQKPTDVLDEQKVITIKEFEEDGLFQLFDHYSLN